jgi:D-alanyl-D-alanine carboxypeptidase (penicillin-binding protein 5/6)
LKRLACILFSICIATVAIKAAAIGTSAKAAILINGDTGEVIYEQNADTRLPMASTTKIMTALMLCEYGRFDREITVTAEMLRVEGSSMGLLPGDRVDLRDLLYGMLLASGNDAANVTAYVLGGNIDKFVRMMNQRAQELGLVNTHFETPSGLDGDEHYTTARDLARLAMFAMKNEEFRTAASSKTATLEYGNPPYRRTLSNHNKLLKIFDGAVGVKTGFTKKSGRCLVSAAQRDGKFVIAVTLNDPNDWEDHKALLNYGLDKIQSAEITPSKTEFELPVISSADQTVKVSIKPKTVHSVDVSGFSYVVNLPKFLYAPVKKGEVIGSVVYYKDGKEIDRRDLTSDRDIPVAAKKPGFLKKAAENFRRIFMDIWES